MSGETEASVSGWTTDTLREHLLARMADQRAALVQQLADQRDSFKQQLADQRDAFHRQLADQLTGDRLAIGEMREMLNERYATQTKALDAAFLAQQTAMKTAFDAADKAVAAALESAEKAVTKAEAAAEKRFESVNEFRQQLTDQAATFVSRTEYTVNHATLNDKFDAEAKRTTERISAIELRLTSRLDLSQGAGAGIRETATDHRYDATFAQSAQIADESQQRATMSAVIAAFSSLVAIAAIIVIALKK